MAAEKLFFGRNVTPAISVGQARGVILLAGARAGLEIVEYTPAEVNQALTGYGKTNASRRRLPTKTRHFPSMMGSSIIGIS